MRLGKYLSGRTKSELTELKEELNLSDDELLVFTELSKGRSIVAVADKCGISTATVSNRERDILLKLKRMKGAGSSDLHK